MNLYRNRGFTLVELIILIVVIGAAAVSLLLAMRYVMPRQFTGAQNTQAAQVAQMRMELVLAQRDVTSLQGFSDPCVGGSPVPALCANPLGFNVTVGISGGQATTADVTVTVRDSANASVLASLYSETRDY